MKLFDRVKIKTTGKTGIIVDVSVDKTSGIAWYIVESDSENKNRDKGEDRWRLYDCKETDLELIL